VSAYTGPELLGADHILDDFDCGDEALNDWLKRRARSNQHSGASRTWVALDKSQHVVGFYASSTAVLMRGAATKRAARQQPDPMPALLLGRLAVDNRHQGHGLAAALLKHFLLKSLEVAEVTGVRLLLVHAKDEQSARFYRHHEFDPSPIDELTLMLLVNDLRAP
jgi:GNAT superfamily N-acetyltransferase